MNALGSLFFLLVAPGVVAGLIPLGLTDWSVDAHWGPLRILGVLLIAAGLPVLLDAFRRFVVEGLGTPAPVAPPERLVVGGLYRHVRNPMYVAVLALIVGQGLLLGQPVLFAYGAAMGVIFFSFVRFYEEPALADQFGVQYDAYRHAVPGWLPRLRPWRP